MERLGIILHFRRYLLVTSAAVTALLLVLAVYNKEKPDLTQLKIPAAVTKTEVAALQSDQTLSTWRGPKRALTSYRSSSQKICEKFNTSEAMCEVIQRRKPESPGTLYPVQFVSGSPGSGNNWMLWLGAAYGYEKSQEQLLGACEVYHGCSKRWIKKAESPGRFFTYCPFIKTHEPYFMEPSSKPKSYVLSVDRAALILRHPFDSAVSEFKRVQIVLHMKKKGLNYHAAKDARAKTDGINLDLFFDKNQTLTNGTTWAKWYPRYLERWRKHALFWLQQYKRPIYIIIYKDFISNTQTELSSLMQFMGYSFHNGSLHRHCCVLEHPFNKNIKRKSSVIDPYKEMLLSDDAELKRKVTEVIEEVQQILDIRWLGIYQIKRG